MLHFRKTLCVFFTALLLVQPVHAETEAPTEKPPEILTAVYEVDTLPTVPDHAVAPHWLLELVTAPLYTMTDDDFEPILAASTPEDVTADYAGTYGIPANAQRGYAFRILLQDSASWEDGSPITAADYRAAILALFSQDDKAGDWSFLANGEAIRTGKARPGSDVISLRQAGYSGISEAWSAGYRDFFLDTEGFWGLATGWRPISDRTQLRDHAMPARLDEAFVSAAYLYNNYLMNDASGSYYQTDFIGISPTAGDVPSINDLGVLAISSQELVLIMEEPATASMVMERLESLVLPGEASYGPYRIAAFSPDEIILEPNPHWCGSPAPRGYDRILCREIGT